MPLPDEVRSARLLLEAAREVTNGPIAFVLLLLRWTGIDLKAGKEYEAMEFMKAAASRLAEAEDLIKRVKFHLERLSDQQAMPDAANDDDLVALLKVL